MAAAELSAAGRQAVAVHRGAQQFLARFTGTEGELFVGRAQEKALVWRTQRRYDNDGTPYAWLVRSTAFINYFYF